MIKVLVNFKYQDQNKVRDNLSTVQKLIIFKNEDEESGFFRALELIEGVIWKPEEYEKVSRIEE